MHPNERELFERLADLAPDVRRERLAALALSNDERARIEALLAADARPTALFEMPVAEAVERMRDDSALLLGMVGETVGPFRLLELIGEGGTAVVFRAERAAGAGSQLVALKLLRTGLYSPAAQQRFQREQAILAQLTHPNIARLIEGGVSAAGAPYIAMELVEGRPITADADARSLALADRVRMMIALCRTIEAAHAALVVHRDLKPGNVLVTRDGDLKVLDFGIAKLLDDDSVAQTRTQTIMLTPEYAAPEQYTGAPVTTAVDVYALGVLLGELVTGARLGSGRGRASDEVTTGRAAAPRGLPAAPLLARRLRGDLDAIISTALADEPTRRFRSAGALADDLERYLAGRPVLARPPSRWYRTQKFVARHRGGVLATVLFLIGILASLGLALSQSVVAERAARVARAEAQRADAMRDFMFDAFADVEPGAPKDEPMTVAEAVERAIRTAQSDRAADPAARIELLTRLAEVLQAQGEVERAAELLATTAREAHDTLGAEHPLTLEAQVAAIGVAVIRNEFMSARGDIDVLLARIPESASALRIALLRNSASVAIDERDRERAFADTRSAMTLSRALGDDSELTAALRNSASVSLAFGELDAAIATYEELLALQRKRHGDVHSKVAAEHAGLSRAYRRQGDLVRAEANARAAIDIDRKVHAGDHWHTALHLNALSMVLIERRAFDDALTSERERLRILEASHGKDYLGRLLSLTNVAVIETQRGHPQAALPLLEESIERASAAFGPNHWTVAGMRAHLGVARAASGDRSGAESALDQAIAIGETLPAANSDLYATILERRARVALDFGDAAAALPLLDRCAAAIAKVTPTPYWDGRIDTLRGEALLALDRHDEAAAALAAGAAALAASEHPDRLLAISNPLLRAALDADLVRARALAEPARAALAHLPYPPRWLQRIEAAAPK